jgi:carbon-monoxide dehydrogenase small subunit
MQKQLVRCNINGKDVETYLDVRASLTDMLRNDYRLTSVKKGCEVGECGACTVLIDGEAFNSCIYMAVWAEGKHIRTLESLLGPGGELSDIQQAFVDEAAVQCGFCTPGFIMTPLKFSKAARSTRATSSENCSRASLPLHGLRKHPQRRRKDDEKTSGQSVTSFS